MAARRHRRGTQAAVPDCSAQRLLADTEKACRLARTDELASRQVGFQSLDVVGEKAAMAARRDQGRLEQAPRDGTKNSRSADTKAMC